MAARLNVDTIPQLGRPEHVGVVLAEAIELRDRLRQANEELAAAEAEYQAQQHADAALAAERARKGAALGAVSPAVEKARHAVDLASRNARALALASEAALSDLDSIMREHADVWLTALDAERQRATEVGLAALAEFERATADVNAAASAASWVRGGVEGQFAPTVFGSLAAFAAPTSARSSANGQAFDVTQITAWARDLLVPPPPPQRRGFGRIAVDASDAA